MRSKINTERKRKKKWQQKNKGNNDKEKSNRESKKERRQVQRMIGQRPKVEIKKKVKECKEKQNSQRIEQEK